MEEQKLVEAEKRKQANSARSARRKTRSIVNLSQKSTSIAVSIEVHTTGTGVSFSLIP